ncbi:hypothetical protein L917_15695 [Phytophthora nicotianae]|uniref:Chromo domain-containing protein n=1 Tax=Phytophthora nicotianae TaxID=4792 RepID=W2KIN9_PHYNI|nr:hypothetical protein L917_15695 [Phytophthora nicotianae]
MVKTKSTTSIGGKELCFFSALYVIDPLAILASKAVTFKIEYKVFYEDAQGSIEQKTPTHISSELKTSTEASNVNATTSTETRLQQDCCARDVKAAKCLRFKHLKALHVLQAAHARSFKKSESRRCGLLKPRTLKKGQRGARKANFSVGDFVLHSRVDQKHQNKMLVTWNEPFQIARADMYSFAVKHLVMGAESDVHASRLKYYADEDFEVTEEVIEHVASQGIVLAVAELKEHRWCAAKKDYELIVSWDGLEPIEDSWEPLRSLWKDIPVMVRDYAERAKGGGLLKHVARSARFAAGASSVT